MPPNAVGMESGTYTTNSPTATDWTTVYQPTFGIATATIGSNIAADDCADDGTSNWSTSLGSIASFLQFDTDHYEFPAPGGSAGANNNLRLISGTYVGGKTYKMSFDVKDGTV